MTTNGKDAELGTGQGQPDDFRLAGDGGCLYSFNGAGGAEISSAGGKAEVTHGAAEHVILVAAEEVGQVGGGLDGLTDVESLAPVLECLIDGVVAVNVERRSFEDNTMSLGRLENKLPIEGGLLLLRTQIVDQIDGRSIGLNFAAGVQDPSRSCDLNMKVFGTFAGLRRASGCQ